MVCFTLPAVQLASLILTVLKHFRNIRNQHTKRVQMKWYPYIACCLGFSVRYLDDLGFDIPDVTARQKFNILVDLAEQRVALKALNHPYRADLKMIEDPCVYELYKIKSIGGSRMAHEQTGAGVDGSTRLPARESLLKQFLVDKKRSPGEQPLGAFNACSRVLVFQHGSKLYDIRYFDSHYRVSRQEYADHADPGTAHNRKFDVESESTDTGEDQNKKYTLRLFVINDLRRTNFFNRRINKVTKKLISMVNRIFTESGATITIRLMGILNLKEVLALGEDPLSDLRMEIEPVRYDPMNSDTGLSRADFILFLNDRTEDGEEERNQQNKDATGASHEEGTNIKIRPLTDNETDSASTQTAQFAKHHGLTYFGGANGLNRSYSIVYAGVREDKYFVAKKMAHELGHALGSTHDRETGSLMEAVTCASCGNAHRIFSDKSLEQMTKFVEQYREIFSTEEQPKQPLELVTSVEEAVKYVKKMRRHSFNMIVEGRLDGKTPGAIVFNYYLMLSMAFYVLSILVAIYYLK